MKQMFEHGWMRLLSKGTYHKRVHSLRDTGYRGSWGIDPIIIFFRWKPKYIPLLGVNHVGRRKKEP